VKSLVVYDTRYGNTEQVANAIAEPLGRAGEVVVKKASETTADDVQWADLVVVGSPTHAWDMTPETKGLFERISWPRYHDRGAAVFDTKVVQRTAEGAAGKIERALGGAGLRVVAKPQSFFVAGPEGPVAEGEIERARAFGEELARAMSEET
jgi:flavodoxin